MDVKKLVYTAMFAVFIAVASQISIPVSPVPINLATAAVMITGGFLGKKHGTLSVVVYILLGAVGLPVFAAFRGGAGVLAGPTGGYIAGYIAMAFLTGYICHKTDKLLLMIFGMAGATAVCYLLGTCWYVFVTDTPVLSALAVCVLPFIFTDIIKIIVSAVIIKKKDRIIQKDRQI
ncbi:MAG: biotin transporter BioY [Clostridia bacterium]|nr:biotin transporter BioY [Clostridia bacterium]